jgi:hypothetical protein
VCEAEAREASQRTLVADLRGTISEQRTDIRTALDLVGTRDSSDVLGLRSICILFQQRTKSSAQAKRYLVADIFTKSILGKVHYLFLSRKDIILVVDTHKWLCQQTIFVFIWSQSFWTLCVKTLNPHQVEHGRWVPYEWLPSREPMSYYLRQNPKPTPGRASEMRTL